MQYNARRPVQIALSSLMVLFGATQAMSAQPVGILGLYEVEDASLPSFKKHNIKSLGCELRREGLIAAEKGDIDIDEPNRFVLLACETSLLGDINKRTKLQDILSQGRTLTILEGALSDESHDKNVPNREYVLKISHYNNENTEQREQDLEHLNNLVSVRPNHYKTESFIAVNKAIGMPTPDEAVVIYYDSTKDGEDFRKNNPDIMNLVGSFNKKHINDYIYYVGKTTKQSLSQPGKPGFLMRSIFGIWVLATMAKNFTLKIAMPENNNQISNLLKVSYSTLMQSGYDADVLAAVLPKISQANPTLLSSGTYYLVQNDDGLIVGCGGWSKDRPGTGEILPNLAHIRHFATHPEWNGLGIGRMIFEECKQVAKFAGMNQFICYSSMNAVSFYSALGFKVTRQVELSMGSGLKFPSVLMEATISV